MNRTRTRAITEKTQFYLSESEVEDIVVAQIRRDMELDSSSTVEINWQDGQCFDGAYVVVTKSRSEELS
jgi:hypothetical protein